MDLTPPTPLDAPARRPLPEPPRLDAGGGVLLRRHRPDDADGIFEQGGDPDMQRWTTVPAPYERQHAQEFLEKVAAGWADGSMAAFAIEVDGRFGGTVDLRLGEGRWAEVGFGLHPAARGRGVMTRAARTALRWGFEELGLVGVHWRAVVGNRASRAVAEKCGFRVEGEVRGLLVARGQRDDGWIGSLLAGELR
ncbi:GNAT family N-acetyltransferase [Streptomyces sp. NP160]|uniref:GNAT family N-acetyltransferase n=1 Tax=Streptomyces sp. NP160 TaxID=2586637 RepID=UPI0015D5E6F0|nr:GNAT family N-acetyltransferase [Streptomyces sp. NP160]